jgi:pectin methylesterase-like acyl-CoA thioesterase
LLETWHFSSWIADGTADGTQSRIYLLVIQAPSPEIRKHHFFSIAGFCSRFHPSPIQSSSSLHLVDALLIIIC